MKTTLTFLTLGTVMALSGCAYFNEEAGAFLDQGEFGNATMNNQLAQTCRKLTPANVTKYGTPLASNCPGRLQDGKYAMFAYEETIISATEQSSATVEGTEEIGSE
ncbi:hypothetical protein [Tropicimonas sediminicola]|uniref:Uncharacterized protein n=1 Tax=Tropicimonas sediminicola TaxID=1031541 RepID=A0A239KKQ3_9RHOB|nr:hypothetical protein [Tropicimonas sediminicola]SNT18272.1 hypothetical protein SAMN05421757_107158 [Tropicimonas sediminicola]